MLITLAHGALAQEVTAPAPPAVPPPPAQPSPFEFSTLRILHEKGVLSDEEYESAVKEAGASTGQEAEHATTVVLSKWATTLYGFAEADAIYDTTQSLNDLSGGAQIARAGTYAGDNDRTQFSIRNSRIGFLVKAPEYRSIRVNGQAEMDFLGTQLPVGYGQPYFGSEAAYFTNATFRIRHMNLRVETPIVDVLMGQYWVLFGWQGRYQPGTAEYQGVPNEIYARTPQFRIAKTWKTAPVTFDVAIAALRPPQRDSASPEGQAGMHLAINDWKGVQTIGATSTSIQPASLAITGDMKNVRLPGYPASTPTNYTQSKVGGGAAVDAFLPLVPSRRGKMGNTLSFTFEGAKGYGTADQYTGLTGGAVIPALPNPMKANPAPSYPQDIDNGIVTFDGKDKLQYIEWHSIFLGLQYYLPGTSGKVFVTTNFSYAGSDNNTSFASNSSSGSGTPGTPPLSKLRVKEFWGDACVFVDVPPSVRFAAEYANFHDFYGDGAEAVDHRGQFSGFLIF